MFIAGFSTLVYVCNYHNTDYPSYLIYSPKADKTSTLLTAQLIQKGYQLGNNKNFDIYIDNIENQIIITRDNQGNVILQQAIYSDSDYALIAQKITSIINRGTP